MGTGTIIVIVVVVLLIFNAIKIIPEFQRIVVFRLGRLVGQRGPGLVIIIPGVDQIIRVDLRTITHDVPVQEVITRDNVTIKVNAVVFFRVMDPSKATVDVLDFFNATSQIAQTTLRSVLGEHELDDLLANREKINQSLQEIIDRQTDPWGIKVSIVEVKDVELPETMKRAIARQAEAERERRAKIIAADAEFQASEKLTAAANVMGGHPIAIQLRYLQTLMEIAAEKNSTTIFPIPIDLLEPFINKARAEVKKLNE